MFDNSATDIERKIAMEMCEASGSDPLYRSSVQSFRDGGIVDVEYEAWMLHLPDARKWLAAYRVIDSL